MNKHPLLFIIYFFLQLFVGCKTNNKENSTNLITNNKEGIINKDSIIEFYSAQIQKHYLELQENEANFTTRIELELDGKRTFENDTLLILSFEEVIKFGSYRYSESSLVFKKKNHQLVPIEAPFLFKNKKININEEIYYPNRIPGYFTKSIDLTGDGIHEYVFTKEFMYKDNIEKDVRIYKIDLQKNILHQLNLEAHSSGFVFTPDTLRGTNERMSFIETSNKEVIVKLVNETTETNSDGDLVIKEIKTSYYKYNPDKNKFIAIK